MKRSQVDRRIRRLMATCTMVATLLGGCAAGQAPAPAPSAAPSAPKGADATAPAAPALPPVKSVPIAGHLSEQPRNVPFSEDWPLFPASEPLGEPLRPMLLPTPLYTIHGDEQTLRQLAEHLRQTGRPEVPPGVQAVLVGMLPGERYIYHLGGYPQHGVYEIYQFRREGDDWVTSPICMDTPWAIWPGPDQVGPIFLCGLQEGSGAVLSLTAYREDQEVLRISGVEDAYFALEEDPAGGPPVIIVSGGIQWLDHKAEPRVYERDTYAWQDGEYVLAKRERRDDWVYHLARFLTLTGEGNYDKAAGEFGTPPAAGVRAYLQAHAPDLVGQGAMGWTTLNQITPPDDVYLTSPGGQGAWFHFRFDQNQHLTAIAEEAPQ